MRVFDLLNYHDTCLYDSPNTNNLAGDAADPALPTELCPDVVSGHSLSRIAVGVDNNLATDWEDLVAPTPTRSQFVGTPITPLAAIRANDSLGVPVLLDSLVTITGIVTCAAQLGTSGPAYIYDNTGAVAIYDNTVPTSGIAIGDSIRATGWVGFFAGLTEMVDEPLSGSPDVQFTIISSGHSQFFVRVKMPQGTSLDATDQVISRIEQEALKLPASERHAVVAMPGIFQSDAEWLFNSSVGQVIVDLKERKDRTLPIDSLMNLLRSRTQDIPGIESLEFAKVNTGPPVGKAVEVKVQGKYFEELEAVAEELKAELAEIPGTYDIDDNFSPGKRQVRIKVNPEKAAFYGLDVTQVASTAYAAFNGLKASVLHDGDDEIDVMVRFPEARMDEIQSVRSLKIRSPQGYWVPFLNVADISVEAGPADIRRFEKERAITVSANVDKAKTSGVEVNRRLIKRFKNIEDRYPGVRLLFQGEFEEFAKAFSGLAELFLIGAGLIFLVLGAEFRSLIQPLIIMIAIPFGFIGAMFGLVVSGNPFSITTLYGFVGLAGVVVNNSIVMLAFINDARAQGVEKRESIIQSGILRLRPIFLTSITTIFGVLPMAIGLGGKSEVWGPLANTFVWGLGVSTLLTLLIVPAVYEFVVDDMGAWFRRKFGLQAAWEKKPV